MKRRLISILGVFAAVLAFASAAQAAPLLSVQATRTPASIHRNDELFSYSVLVSNTQVAVPQAGEKLSCSTTTAAWTNAAFFTYQWLRDGVPIVGATATEFQLSTADNGHSMQCQVTATNATATTSSTAVTAPIVATPVPAPGPPAPTAPTNESSRPTITGTGGALRTCNPPASWSGSPVWAYQWLRNGVAIAAATSQTYTPGAEDVNKVLQCKATGTNAGGAAAAISVNSADGSPSTPPANSAASTPTLKGSLWTAGTTSLTVALPPGLKLKGGSGNSWSCSVAALTCSSTTEVAPGAQFPLLNLELWVIPEEAPESPTVTFDAYGGGATGDSIATDSFTFSAAVPFGFSSFTAGAQDLLGADYTQAGGHPFSATTSFTVNTRTYSDGRQFQAEDLRDIVAELPAGFVGNLTSVPTQCRVYEVRENLCPAAAVVGGAAIQLEPEAFFGGVPIYRVAPEAGYVAAFAFQPHPVSSLSVVIRVKLRSNGDYGVTASAPLAPQWPNPIKAEYVTLCGFGTKVTSAKPGERAGFLGCREATDPFANEEPFLTNPTRCAGDPPVTRGRTDSWQHPGAVDDEAFPDLSDPNWKSYEAVAPQTTGCNQVEFDPTIEGRPTTNVADAPSGLEFNLHIPQQGLKDPEGLASADLKDSTVVLPEGMVVNPSSATGLGACSATQIGLRTAIGASPAHFTGKPARCPAVSKLGEVEVSTPLLDKPLKGSVYLAKQFDNPFNSLLALYIAIDDPETGIVAKLPGKITPDPVTGRLTATFLENPELPFEDLHLEVFKGARASLRTPATCGPKTTTSEFTPWSAPESGPPATPSDIFETLTAPGGGHCATNASELPNAPRFTAGTISPKAGAYSPFVLKLGREDGSQELKGLNATLPPGLTGRLAGVSYCSQAGIDRATARNRPGEGSLEQADPSCPAASEVGSVDIAAGAGPLPFHATGHAYLAGPYKGAPISLVVITPAVAGPFDLGAVVVRNALNVDPVTAQVSVSSDPFPTILEGIPLDIRQITVSVTRDRFTLNPTSCAPMSVAATAIALSSNASLSDRFQVGECSSLAFKPRLSLRLRGGTARSAHPALTATLTQPEGQANIGAVSVALPHSEFLDQGHIRTVCTRPQFAAHECPQGSIYGEAEATTPLLDQPLKGAVYLRSSSNKLPDLVVSLRGPESQPVEVDLAGRIDSIHGGIRNTFNLVPDAPVTRFALRMQGGNKGLLVNSRNLCADAERATVRMVGQNGKRQDSFPVLKNDCKKAGKPAGRFAPRYPPKAR
jgi:hypothetical protein